MMLLQKPYMSSDSDIKGIVMYVVTTCGFLFYMYVFLSNPGIALLRPQNNPISDEESNFKLKANIEPQDQTNYQFTQLVYKVL